MNHDGTLTMLQVSVGNEVEGRKEKAASESSEHCTSTDCGNLWPGSTGLTQCPTEKAWPLWAWLKHRGLGASWHYKEAKPGANVQGLGSCPQREDREVKRHHLWPLKGERRKNDEGEREREVGAEREPHEDTIVHLWSLKGVTQRERERAGEGGRGKEEEGRREGEGEERRREREGGRQGERGGGSAGSHTYVGSRGSSSLAQALSGQETRRAVFAVCLSAAPLQPSATRPVPE